VGAVLFFEAIDFDFELRFHLDFTFLSLKAKKLVGGWWEF